MILHVLFKYSGRLCAALGLMLFMGGMACFSPVYAAGKTNLPAIQKQAEVDLNGSGKPMKIAFSINPKTSTFTLTVAGSSQSAAYDLSDAPPKGFSIVAIDTASKYREIVVECPGASDANAYYIFDYDENKLNKIGELSSSVEFPGDGSVRVQDWSGFWVTHDKYVLERQKHALKRVPQEFYYVGTPATVKKTFPIYTSPDKQTEVANVKPGSKVMLLLCAPPVEEGPKWYLLKTQDNLIGWVKEEIIQDHLDGIRWAG